MERDRVLCETHGVVTHFNSHAHVERDSITIESFQNNDYFNSHAHVERDPIADAYLLTAINFNSHAHVERDTKYYVHHDIRNDISTHTLTWSVTRRVNSIIKLINISTHTLTWSVTGVTTSSPADSSDFNSHAHVERDIQKSDR